MKTVMYGIIVILFSTASLAAEKPSRSAPTADEETQLDSTTIYGDRELPKAMYVVPWKKPQLGELINKPVMSLLDESLEPLDRDEFRRSVDYFETLHHSEAALD